MIERRKVIIILLSTLILIFISVHWLVENKKKTFNKWDVLESHESLKIVQEDEDDEKLFGPDNFDEALFINGPKRSQFETDESRLRSINYVKWETF